MTASRKRRWARWLAGTLAGILLLDVACSVAYTRSVEASYVRPLPAGKAYDAAIVFYADYGELGHRTAPLLEEAVGLLEQKRVARLICAGGNRPSTGHSGCEQARQWLLARGVPAESVAVDRVSRDTIGNMREAARILREAGGRSAVLLSHSWHAPRVAAVAASNGALETVGLAPSLEGWSRALYWTEALRSSNHEAVSWLIWKVLGQRLHDALVEALRP